MNQPVTHGTLPAWRGLARASLLAAALVAATPLTAQTASQTYQIPPGPLTETLNRFGAQAGILLSFSTEQTGALRSQGLQGSYSVPEALQALLAGTGLHAEAQPGGGYVLRPGGDAASSPAPASAPPARSAAEQSEDLSEAVVSARRARLYETPDVNAGALGVREMKDLPFSIGSYTTDTVENQRARTALDVLRNDPSVSTVTYGASFDGVAVRGFSANTFNNVRRDGLLGNVYADVPLENKERVDVLKGVSGFLYGVGDPSGLVNYVLKRPTRERMLSLTAEARTQSGYYANLDAGGPVGDGRLGYRLHAAREKVGNFRHPGDLERDFVGAALDAKLHPDAILQLDFDYQRKSQSANASLGPLEDGSLLPAASVNPRQLIGQPWARYRSRSWNLGARLDYALNTQWTLTGQLGYGHTFRNALFHNIGSLAPNGDVLRGNMSYEGEPYRATSGQLFATGRFSTGSIGHELVAGYSYSRMRYPEGPYTRLSTQVDNIHHPTLTPWPELPHKTQLPTAHATQHSLFVSDTIELTPRWSLLLGARYIDYVNDKPRDYPDSGVRLRYSTQSTIPAASLMFKPAEHTTLYATYTKGFEQGAYAPGWADNAYERLEPITSRQWEVGIKSQVRDGLLLTAAYFDIDKPLQAVSAVDNRFKTQGRQRHRGLELAANGQITRQLSGIASMGWIDASQRQTGEANVDGHRPGGVPRFQASVFLDWRIPAVPGLSIHGGAYHMGSRPLSGGSRTTVPGHTRLDVGAAYAMRVGGHPAVLRLNVHNLSNKRYWDSVVYGTVGMAQPRTVRLSFTAHF